MPLLEQYISVILKMCGVKHCKNIPIQAEAQKCSGYYRMYDSLCVCSGLNGLMEELRFLQYLEEWRPFIYGLKQSLLFYIVGMYNCWYLLPIQWLESHMKICHT